MESPKHTRQMMALNRDSLLPSLTTRQAFEYESREILQIYERICGEPVNMDVSVEEIMKSKGLRWGCEDVVRFSQVF